MAYLGPSADSRSTRFMQWLPYPIFSPGQLSRPRYLTRAVWTLKHLAMCLAGKHGRYVSFEHCKLRRSAGGVLAYPGSFPL